MAANTTKSGTTSWADERMSRRDDIQQHFLWALHGIAEETGAGVMPALLDLFDELSSAFATKTLSRIDFGARPIKPRGIACDCCGGPIVGRYPHARWCSGRCAARGRKRSQRGTPVSDEAHTQRKTMNTTDHEEGTGP